MYTSFYAVSDSVNGLHRDRVRVSVRVSGRVRVMACRPDSSGNLLTPRKIEFAQLQHYVKRIKILFGYSQLSSVTTMLVELGLPSFNTVLHI